MTNVQLWLFITNNRLHVARKRPGETKWEVIGQAAPGTMFTIMTRDTEGREKFSEIAVTFAPDARP